MKKYLLVTMLLGIIALLAAAPTLAQNNNNHRTIEFVNHFGKTLTFKVTQGRKYLSPRARQFKIKASRSKILKVKIPNEECARTPESDVKIYISANIKGVSPKEHYAFFGIKLLCPTDGKQYIINISGYLDKNIAYSWKDDPKKAIITFCRPKDYPCM